MYDRVFHFRVYAQHNCLHVYVHACAHACDLCAHACDLCAHACDLCLHACVHHIYRHACALYYDCHVRDDESNYGFHEA